MVGLYGSVISFITLIFAYIDQAFPDALEASMYYNYDPYSGSIRFAMASLIVLVPVTILLLQLIRKDIAKDHAKADVWVRRWALFLTLFLAGLAMVIDLITLINYFLGGEVTTRFVLKVATILLVAAAVFMHFLADYWGYWIKFPKRAMSVGIAAGVLVILAIISGFFIIGSPASVRLQRFDGQKITDMQNIQWQIINYYQTKGKLPVNLAEVADPISGTVIPKDPQSGQDYGYRITTAPYSFELCAVFNKDSVTAPGTPEARPITNYGMDNDTWTHGTGQICFERTIDPERYPIYPKGTPVKS
jgi:type II secretory pathway pseudopilin PulG